MVTTLLEILACVLFAAGVAIVAGTLIAAASVSVWAAFLRRCRSWRSATWRAGHEPAI